MREKLNSNPMVQAVVLGILALIVGFLIFTRVVSSGAGVEADSSPATAAPAAATAAPATPPASTVAEPATPPEAAPPPGDVSPTVDPGAFVAGPGLPADVVKAYAEDKVVMLLVIRGSARQDNRVAEIARNVGSRDDVALFVVKTADIAEYSRIAQGFNVDRTPALIVIEPRASTRGALPRATISYGFRGPSSIEQSIDDALYRGKENLPYHP